MLSTSLCAAKAYETGATARGYARFVKKSSTAWAFAPNRPGNSAYVDRLSEVRDDLGNVLPAVNASRSGFCIADDMAGH
jgi:hypothetical protein